MKLVAGEHEFSYVRVLLTKIFRKPIADNQCQIILYGWQTPLWWDVGNPREIIPILIAVLKFISKVVNWPQIWIRVWDLGFWNGTSSWIIRTIRLLLERRNPTFSNIVDVWSLVTISAQIAADKKAFSLKIACPITSYLIPLSTSCLCKISWQPTNWYNFCRYSLFYAFMEC